VPVIYSLCIRGCFRDKKGEKYRAKMSSPSGSHALIALKSKMQSLREELDKVHDQLEAKSREVEAERESRAQVS